MSDHGDHDAIRTEARAGLPVDAGIDAADLNCPTQTSQRPTDQAGNQDDLIDLDA